MTTDIHVGIMQVDPRNGDGYTGVVAVGTRLAVQVAILESILEYVSDSGKSENYNLSGMQILLNHGKIDDAISLWNEGSTQTYSIESNGPMETSETIPVMYEDFVQNPRKRGKV